MNKLNILQDVFIDHLYKITFNYACVKNSTFFFDNLVANYYIKFLVEYHIMKSQKEIGDIVIYI